MSNTRFLKLLNYQTLSVLLVSMGSCYTAVMFEIDYNYDLLLLNLAITFPLSFSIQAAFRRRERALEFLSLFKSSLVTVHQVFQFEKKLPSRQKEEARKMLQRVADDLLGWLSKPDRPVDQINADMDKVFFFISDNKGQVSKSAVQRVIRYMKDVYRGGQYLISMSRHRTVQGLRMYCIVFIYLYSLVNAPVLLHHVGFEASWLVYMICFISSLLLITLYNIQEQMENPFDQSGLDDIILKDFRL
ncbi:MAG: hypothetical protein ACKOAR_10020 [Bacteroidota bacterium]